MSNQNDPVHRFKVAYLDYLEELRPEPPTLDDLSDEQRAAAQRFIDSLEAARGVDPYASRPSIAELMARAQSTRSSNDPVSEIAERLESDLQATLEGATVVTDAASAAAGLAAVLVIYAGGLRIRVLIEPEGTDLDTAYRSRVEAISAIFGAFPDTSVVLFMMAGPAPVGVIIDRTDIHTAIETPSGQERPPRISRPVDQAGSACSAFLSEVLPQFTALDTALFPIRADSDHLDLRTIASKAVDDIVSSGQRARIEAKRDAWSAFGDAEVAGLAALLADALSALPDQTLRRQIDDIVEAAA